MLELRNIKKIYEIGDTVTEALKGISIGFRQSEFVAVLGPSGCGKTTLLNVIGGLDKYSSGDLIINGRTTKEYKDSDWDKYRNHSIGFVFQSYNLIPHQTVLANVELALTLSGVSKSERKERAMNALAKVGIADQAKKKPNQLSGGQMQRVAIARALVNNPDILLADEPTGALDSATSIQIMDILKEIAKDKLVIMVTHNPELANEYASRIVTLKDGEIIGDNNPFVPEEIKKEDKKVKTKKYRTSMSFATALSLSLNNLLTKKTRTLLTSFAGSIGIIGIALILSLSSGFKAYINKVQEDTLTQYPISITKSSVDMSSFMNEFMGTGEGEIEHELDKIYARPVFGKLANSFSSSYKENDLKAFKEYVDANRDDIKDYVTDIKYSYGVKMNVYSKNTNDGVIKVNPMDIMSVIMGDSSSENSVMTQMGGVNSSSDIWTELIDNRELHESQYELIDGHWPEAYNEVVLFVDENHEITDYILCALGLEDQAETQKTIADIMAGKSVKDEMQEFTYDEILGLEFSLVPTAATYQYNEALKIWEDKSNNVNYMKELIDDGTTIKIVGIFKPNVNSKATSSTGIIGYTPELTKYCIEKNNEYDVVKAQKDNPDTDIFTGLPFQGTVITIETVMAAIEQMDDQMKAQFAAATQGMTEEEIVAFFTQMTTGGNTTNATYEGNLIKLGAAELDTPSTIHFFAKDFDAKDEISAFIDKYNDQVEEDGDNDKVIRYTDFAGMMMNSISTIIDVISYVLIAFVAISLIVSSIMIGIITYISVLERTKEIGILRSIGASKHDISSVFNAETLIVGFISGLFGILATILLNIPVNMIIKALGDIENVSKLPVAGAIILVLISMFLTFIAGLIPARVASKKDPVVALRTE